MGPGVGTLIAGRYRVVEYLDGGSFGEVYKVRDLYQDATVALKLLRRAPVPSPWLEAQVLTRLGGPYILPVWNADFDAGVPFIVTRFMENGSAEGRRLPSGVPPGIAVEWTRHACRGAARMLDDRLLHRDIKPENVFITAANDAVLGDMGLAALLDPNGEAPWAGTPQTMAPEVAALGNTSVASDVYSLGATLYALLAGEYAHDDTDAGRLLHAVGNDPPVPLRDVAPHVGRALAQRVAKAMARDPSDRYTSPAEFDATLGDLPKPPRDWSRTDEHQGHYRCFRGEAIGKADVTVCASAAGTRFEVLAVHQPSGRRIVNGCRPPSPPSQLPRNLRAAIAATS